MLLSAGCRRDQAAKQVRELRMAGQADSARALALAELQQQSNRMDLWREFAHATLDIMRQSEEEDQTQNLEFLVQSAIVCAAVYQHSKQDPGKEWMEISRLVSSEIVGQTSRMRRVMQTQAQSANFLKQLVGSSDTMSVVPLQITKARQALQSYRNEARNGLMLTMIFRRLSESLPEQNPGTVSLMNEQIDEIMGSWTSELSLDQELTAPVQLKARQTIDAALNRANGDLTEVGYFLVPTILENGVLE